MEIDHIRNVINQVLPFLNQCFDGNSHSYVKSDQPRLGPFYADASLLADYVSSGSFNFFRVYSFSNLLYTEFIFKLEGDREYFVVPFNGESDACLNINDNILSSGTPEKLSSFTLRCKLPPRETQFQTWRLILLSQFTLKVLETKRK